MAKFAFCHALHDAADRIVHVAGGDITRHHLRNRQLQSGTSAIPHRAHDIALRQNADEAPVGVEDHQRTFEAKLNRKSVISEIGIVRPCCAATDAVGRPCHQSRATRREHHRPVAPADHVAGKRLELLREAVPGLRRLAILANTGNPAVVLEMHEVQSAADALGLEVVTSEIRQSKDIAAAFDAFKSGVDALYVCTDPLVITNRARIHTLAIGARLPTIYNSREYVETGGLMSYGPNWPDRWRRAAEIVDKILRGAKPADIPVEQPTKFDLIVNLTTAKVLDLAVPPSLIAVADEVIE